jgi:hypothetical protein
MHRSISDVVLANKPIGHIDIDMVLVAVVAFAVLFSPTRLYPTFRTSNWHIEYFNEAIGFPEVADRALSQ